MFDCSKLWLDGKSGDEVRAMGDVLIARPHSHTPVPSALAGALSPSLVTYPCARGLLPKRCCSSPPNHRPRRGGTPHGVQTIPQFHVTTRRTRFACECVRANVTNTNFARNIAATFRHSCTIFIHKLAHTHTHTFTRKSPRPSMLCYMRESSPFTRAHT